MAVVQRHAGDRVIPETAVLCEPFGGAPRLDLVLAREHRHQLVAALADVRTDIVEGDLVAPQSRKASCQAFACRSTESTSALSLS
jgi:hypothetical protein